MNKQPLITIITITYNLIKNNRQDFIIQNINSVHNQIYRNIEHIIIDGASDDGTLELLKPYEEKGWIKVYSEPDNGIYDAMNKGIKKVKGDYISFLNSDDFYHDKNGLLKVVETFNASKCDFVYSACRYLTIESKPFATANPLLEWFYIRMPFCHQTLFVKKELMHKLNGFDLNYKSAGDMDFVIRMFLAKAYGQECPINFVSYRAGGLSNIQQEQSIKETISLLEKNFKPLLPENTQINWEDMYYKMKINENLFNIIIKNIHPLFVDKLEKFWNTIPCSNGTKLLSNLTNIIPFIVLKQVKLFGFLTIFKIKQNETNKKWYIFGIPIFRIKQNMFNRKYYFCSIPIFKIPNKNNRNKQKIVIFGNCLTYPIYEMLHINSEFNQKYDIEILKFVFQCEKCDVSKIHNAVKNCDILITQPISDQKYVDLKIDTVTLKTYLDEKALCIQLPSLFFNGYTPEQFYLRDKSNNHVGVCEGLPHPYHNKLILFGYINNLSPQETLNILNSNGSIKDIKKCVKDNLEELKRRDENIDIKISDFIENNYKDMRLFWTINHPTKFLIQYIVNELAKLLKLNSNIVCREDFLGEIKTPILNSVKNELQLNFNDNNFISIEEIENYYKYYDNNIDLVKINENVANDFCKEIEINKKGK